MTPRCVLFDFDGVLADYDKHVRVEHLAHAVGVTHERIQQAVYSSGIEEAGDCGDLDADAYLAALSQAADANISVAAWVAARRAATRLRPDIMAVVERLAEHVQIALLTNNGVLMARHLGDIAPGLFPRFAGHCFASAQFGCSKPEPAVYSACLRRLGMSAAQTLFIDDSADNVAGARIAGLHVHHYQGLQPFLDVLKAYGLL